MSKDTSESRDVSAMGGKTETPNTAGMVDAARRGDPVAWRGLVEDVGPRLAGFARSQGIRDADDFTQDVLTAVARGIGRFDGDWEAFRSWVFSIAYRRSKDHHRKRYRLPEQASLSDASSVSSAETPETVMIAEEEARAALSALEVLNPIERDVVTLRVLAELSSSEVAEVVGKRPGTVRVIQSRAVAKMRRHLEESQKLRNATVFAAMTRLYMRLLRRPDADFGDPFSAGAVEHDPVTRWAAELREAVVTKVDPSWAAALAEQVAGLVPVVAATSLAIGSGAVAGSATGGMTMTTATAAATTGISAFLNLKRLVAAVSATAVIAGGAAVTGNLPDSAQTWLADLGAEVGIELPRPLEFGLVETVSVGSAGKVELGLRGGALSILDVQGESGWRVGAIAETDGGATVELVSDEAVMTLTATIDATGEIVTNVTTDVTGGIGSNLESESAAGVDAGAEIDSEASADRDQAQLGTDLIGEVRVGIGLDN